MAKSLKVLAELLHIKRLWDKLKALKGLPQCCGAIQELLNFDDHYQQ